MVNMSVNSTNLANSIIVVQGHSGYVVGLLGSLTVVAAFGCVNNGLILAVFVHSKPIRKIKTLTSLIALAVVDLANCAALCVMLIYTWATSALLSLSSGSRNLTCLIVGQVLVFTNLMSSFMMLYIALDRWWAMYRPFEHHAKNHRQSILRWMIATTMYSTLFYLAPIAEENEPWMGFEPLCKLATPLWSQIYSDALKVQNAVMGLLLVAVYFLARYQLKKHHADILNGETNNAWINTQNLEQEKALTKVIMTTLTPFLLLVSFPNIVLLGLRVFSVEGTGLFGTIAILGSYLNSLINIFIYLAKHTLFRSCLIKLLRCDRTKTTAVKIIPNKEVITPMGIDVSKLQPKNKINPI